MAIKRNSITLPSQVSSEIIKTTQNESAIMKLAKKITLPGRGLTIPVITGDPTAEWVAEGAAKPVSEHTLSTKLMTGYKIAVIEPFTNEFKRDTGALYDEMVGRLPGVLANLIDSTVLGATAVPGANFDTFSSCTAQSILNANNGTYLGLVAADVDISEHNGIMNGLALGSAARGLLLSAADTTNRPLFLASASEGVVDKVLGVNTYFNKGIYKAPSGGKPAMVGIAGDWSKAIIGIVNNIDISISDQATLTSGDTTINLWQQNMFAVRAEMEIGFRADTKCFNLLTGATS